MSDRTFELPPEAVKLVEQVRALEAHARDISEQVQGDLAGIRKAAADERAAVSKTAADERADAERRHAQHLKEREVLDASARQQAQQLQAELADKRRKTAAERASIERRRSEITEEIARNREALQTLLENRVRGFAFIADAWADYESARAESLAAALEDKKRPAFSAAMEVRAKGGELADMRRELKRTEWVLALYEFHFPWLTELRDVEEEDSYVEGEPGLDEDVNIAPGAQRDPAQRWLSKEEYAALSEAERNQRALDRYLVSRKTPWQVGRDYERYIGYLREQAGATVIYQGIFAGLEDLGRDLMCETSGGIEVVQCKRWAQHKTIHEKHVFQLFGTVVAMRIEHPDKTVNGTFTTTTTLSERARQFAGHLGIRVEEAVPLADYPRIKCNIGRDRQRIYHLPFDQQYDMTVIEPAKGEHWVSTVAEAQQLGFRRAWKWKGASTPYE